MDENKDNATTTTAGVTPADTRVYKTPESQRAYMKAYYQAHKEQIKAYTTTWRKAHPEAVKRYNKKFNENQKKLRDEKRKAAMADAKPATPPTPKKKKAKRELLMTKRAICQRKWYARQKARKALAEKAAELGLAVVVKPKQKLTPEEVRARANAYAREQYKRHPEVFAARMKKYYESHKEQYRIRSRAYFETHREQWKVYLENRKKKLESDPVARERQRSYRREYSRRPEVRARRNKLAKIRRAEKKRASSVANMVSK